MLSDADRATLGEIGHRLGRKVLAEVATVARPDTIWPSTASWSPVNSLARSHSHGERYLSNNSLTLLAYDGPPLGTTVRAYCPVESLAFILTASANRLGSMARKTVDLSEWALIEQQPQVRSQVRCLPGSP
jgi:hypothetical protein